ncbi:MAG: InlB B-repeat-containing protein, partial [Bacilli bacterium]|nr:InlB B-repeat-containing protein [Bacilli bacterium]
GTVSNNSVDVIFDQPYELPEPERLGYAFLGWYDGLTQIPSSGVWKFPEDKELTARWEIITYSITYNLNGGEMSTIGLIAYTVESPTFALPEAAKFGYTFLGWKNADGNFVSSVPTGSTGDLVLTATWNDGNEYTVTLDPNGGSVDPTSIKVNYDQEYELPTPERKGYRFLGWNDGTAIFPATDVWRIASDKSLEAVWELIEYTITYDLAGGTNDENNPTSYTVNDSVALADPQRDGYTFAGWTDADEQAITAIPVGSVGDISLIAHWDAILHGLTVTSSDDAKGTVEIIKGTGYTDEEIGIRATPAENCVFKGWYRDGKLWSESATTFFIMPASDCAIEALFWNQAEVQEDWRVNHGGKPILSEDGKNMTYGLYPQKRVTDASLLTTLGGLETPESNGWYLLDGEYYAKLIGKPYTSGTKFDDGAKVMTGETYWFHCSPIDWKVLSSETGKALVVSSMLLDAHAYDASYSNNYKDSDIRAWLNSDFLSSAFCLGDSAIQTTLVDNSKATTASLDNKWTCEDTNDKVFLLSYQDYRNVDYFLGVVPICKTTDYVRANGGSSNVKSDALNNGWYWTRSPDANGLNYAQAVDSYHSFTAGYVPSSYLSVRPAMTIDLSKTEGPKNLSPVRSEDPSKGTVAIVSGLGFVGEKITVQATPKDGYYFKGWYFGDFCHSENATFSFTVSSSDQSLEARFLSALEVEELGMLPVLSMDGKTLTYGLFPQTRVSDASLIEALNALPSAESNGWYLYEGHYYAKQIGQKFPSGTPYYFDDGQNIVSDTLYWFACEPIQWKVLSHQNGEALLLSSLLLDAHSFNRSFNGKTNGVYANDYANSSLRQWLNADFLNSAFSLSDSAIKTTNVDNSAATTSSSENPYSCANTSDKVFLLSYQDYFAEAYGLSGDGLNRCAKTTDFARARLAAVQTDGTKYLNNGYFWTRSPDPTYGSRMSVFDWAGQSVVQSVDTYSTCVRPAMTISLS